VFFYNGLPDRSGRGFALTLAGFLCFMFGFALFLHLTETTDVSSVSDGCLSNAL
jgi:hypothetical protein